MSDSRDTPRPLTEPFNSADPFAVVAEVVRAGVLTAMGDGARQGTAIGGIMGAEAVEVGFAGALTALLQVGFAIVAPADRAAVVDVLKAYIPQAWQQADAMADEGVSVQ